MADVYDEPHIIASLEDSQRTMDWSDSDSDPIGDLKRWANGMAAAYDYG
jgi:hypothetical protein